jgi:hypothetical protein
VEAGPVVPSRAARLAYPAGATASGQALKEQVFWVERFATFEDLRAAVREFATTHSEFATTHN